MCVRQNRTAPGHSISKKNTRIRGENHMFVLNVSVIVLISIIVIIDNVYWRALMW